MKRPFKPDFIVFGLIAGTAFAVILSAIITVWEVKQNPGGIFRGPDGMNWSFVRDTAVSWFFPALIDAVIAAAAGHLFFTTLIRTRRTLLWKEDDSTDNT